VTRGYRVFVGLRSGEHTWSLDVGNAVSAPLTLSPGSYYIVIRAYDAAGRLGPPSDEAVVDLAPPGAPTALSATTLGSRATLSWGAPIEGAEARQYLLYVGTAPGTWDIANGYAVGNVRTASGDLPVGRYFARARAANFFGPGPPSHEVSFTIGAADAPTPPGGLAASWNGTIVTLSWTPSPAAASYVIEAGSAPGASNVASFPVGPATSYSTDVLPGTYYVRVRAANLAGVSGPSNEIVVQGRGAPERPTNLTQVGASGTVHLRWLRPSGGPVPTGYVVEAGSAPGLADLASIQVGALTSFSASAPPGTYYVRVRAVNARGSSPPSNEIVVRR
jgi:predicted phage tail protein